MGGARCARAGANRRRQDETCRNSAAGANSRNVRVGARTGNPFDPHAQRGRLVRRIGPSALACDMLPVCTGSDTGGSLRIPGGINGVVGFRPSPGLVAVERRGLGWTPISVVGPARPHRGGRVPAISGPGGDGRLRSIVLSDRCTIIRGA